MWIINKNQWKSVSTCNTKGPWRWEIFLREDGSGSDFPPKSLKSMPMSWASMESTGEGEGEGGWWERMRERMSCRWWNRHPLEVVRVSTIFSSSNDGDGDGDGDADALLAIAIRFICFVFIVKNEPSPPGPARSNLCLFWAWPQSGRETLYEFWSNGPDLNRLEYLVVLFRPFGIHVLSNILQLSEFRPFFWTWNES